MVGARGVATTAVLTALLFLQEEALSFVPNVQLTFVLLLVIGAVAGGGYGTLAVAVHVLLDNTVNGSLSPAVVVPMFIGYEITMLLGRLIRGRSAVLAAAVGGAASWLYCMCFALSMAAAAALAGDPFSLKGYLIADIPFEIVLVVCSVVTVLALYKPLVNAAARAAGGFHGRSSRSARAE